jgi:Fe-S-cluster-containing hydrogenase component 2
MKTLPTGATTAAQTTALQPPKVVLPPEAAVKEGPVLTSSKGHIVVNLDICGGCRTCEAVCSLYKEGISNPELARIQVFKDELGGYICEPMVCKQCDDPACLLACPTGALHVDGMSGARVIDEKECIGCKSCMEACSFTPPRIRFNAAKSKSFKCDLCNGDPQCVKFCPTGSLTFVKKDL